ncbi:MAG TPA: hypothetical protein VGC39_07025 [Candidatus Methylacidiphilales bacterium]
MNEIKAMTPEERGQVAEFLRQLENAPSSHQVDDMAIEELSDRILDRHSELMRKLAS